MKRFIDRVALVTGGASGIGHAVAARLMSEGARAIVWDVDETRLSECARIHGAAALCQRVDVTDPASIAAALDLAAARFGGLDILVNAAGIIHPNTPFWEMPVEQWNRVMAVNLTGPFLVTSAARPYLAAQGRGRVVNIASVTGKEGPPLLAAYAASKAGVISLTKSMAKDLVGSGVIVTAIAPALIQTEMLDRLSPEYYQAAMSRIPQGRAGTLDEAASMAAWLCSAECSFSTGATFDLSGGRATY